MHNLVLKDYFLMVRLSRNELKKCLSKRKEEKRS